MGFESSLTLSSMFIKVFTSIALIGSAAAFTGLAPMCHNVGMKPAGLRSVPLRAAGPSMKIGVFYGTSTGNTESVATRISEKLGAEKCEDIGSIEPAELATYDTLIVGAPTWHTGEDKERSGTDWDSIIYADLPGMDLSGKKVAFFGCGDSLSYGDYFCDALDEDNFYDETDSKIEKWVAQLKSEGAA